MVAASRLERPREAAAETVGTPELVRMSNAEPASGGDQADGIRRSRDCPAGFCPEQGPDVTDARRDRKIWVRGHPDQRVCLPLGHTQVYERFKGHPGAREKGAHLEMHNDAHETPRSKWTGRPDLRWAPSPH